MQTNPRLSQLCPPCARPSFNSSLDHRNSDARAAENGFAEKSSVNKSAKVVLVTTALLAPLPAQASTITVFAYNSFGAQILAYSEIVGYSTNFLGDTSGGVVSALQTGNTFESPPTTCTTQSPTR